MDYNYVRMRNAASRGDTELAAKYRRLYEAGKSGADPHMLDWLIALLLAVAVALGVYIAAAGTKSAAVTETEQTEQEQSAGNEEKPDYVTRPDDGYGTEAENGEDP